MHRTLILGTHTYSLQILELPGTFHASLAEDGQILWVQMSHDLEELKVEIENRLPQLSDLKETGAAEEDVDVVLFVHRPERYAKNHGHEELRGLGEFIIAKQRCGPVGA